MTPDETARVLAKCAAYDRRTTGRADVAAWHEALQDVDFEAALTAVAKHYRDTTEWIMPAHIRRIIRGSETDRLPYYVPFREQGLVRELPRKVSQ